jgi:hypothetical protein
VRVGLEIDLGIRCTDVRVVMTIFATMPGAQEGTPQRVKSLIESQYRSSEPFEHKKGAR